MGNWTDFAGSFVAAQSSFGRVQSRCSFSRIVTGLVLPVLGGISSALTNSKKGEKRYWLHVAIDRFTGEIIDQQLEAVYE